MNNRLSFSIFVVLFIGSIVFYLERTAILDISFHLFYLTQGDFAIQNFRFVAFLTQLFPLTGIYLGLSLKLLMILYSCAFVLAPFGLYLLVRFVIKEKDLALVLALSMFWMVNDTFFWIQSELPQGLWFLITYIALFRSSISKDVAPAISQAFLFLLLLIMAFSHPLIIFPLMFCFVFFGMKYKRNQLFWGQILVYLSLLLIKQLFFKNAYDAQAIGGLSNFKSLFPNYFLLDTNIQFLKDLVFDYYLLLISAILAIGYYIKEKQWPLLTTYLIFSGAFLLMINVSYAGKNPEKFYIENLYLPLAVMVLIPLVIDVFPKIKNKNLIYYSLLIAFILRAGQIYWAAAPYEDRVVYLENYSNKLASLNENKVIIPADSVDLKTLKMNWAFSYEMWLISTLKNNQTQSVVLEEIKDEFLWTMDRTDAFVTKWGVFDYSQLNPSYFRSLDVNKKYQHLRSGTEE